MLGGEVVYERLVAGAFAGAGGLLSLYLGVTHNIPELYIAGSLLLSNMMAFFAGEKNGQRKAQTT